MRRSIIFLIGLVILCMTGQPTVAQRSIVPVQEVDMLFAGDIMQHVGQLNMARLPNGRYSYSYYYRHIKDFIKKADISVANLETPIGKKNFSGYPMFCAPDSFLYAIKDAGFNVLLFANNHCCDKGKSGAMHTLICSIHWVLPTVAYTGMRRSAPNAIRLSLRRKVCASQSSTTLMAPMACQFQNRWL